LELSRRVTPKVFRKFHAKSGQGTIGAAIVDALIEKVVDFRFSFNNKQEEKLRKQSLLRGNRDDLVKLLNVVLDDSVAELQVQVCENLSKRLKDAVHQLKNDFEECVRYAGVTLSELST
jgi:hypothetical protein